MEEQPLKAPSIKAKKILASSWNSINSCLVHCKRFKADRGPSDVESTDVGRQVLCASRKNVDSAVIDNGLGNGCLWNSSCPEAAVGLASEMLSHQLESLDWAELETLPSQVSTVINNRPMGELKSEDDYHQMCKEDEHSPLDNIDEIISDIEELVLHWPKEYIQTTFTILIKKKARVGNSIMLLAEECLDVALMMRRKVQRLFVLLLKKEQLNTTEEISGDVYANIEADGLVEQKLVPVHDVDGQSSEKDCALMNKIILTKWM